MPCVITMLQVSCSSSTSSGMYGDQTRWWSMLSGWNMFSVFREICIFNDWLAQSRQKQCNTCGYQLERRRGWSHWSGRERRGVGQGGDGRGVEGENRSEGEGGKLNLIVDECVASTIKMNFPPHSLPSKNTQSNLNLAYMHLLLLLTSVPCVITMLQVSCSSSTSSGMYGDQTRWWSMLSGWNMFSVFREICIFNDWLAQSRQKQCNTCGYQLERRRGWSHWSGRERRGVGQGGDGRGVEGENRSEGEGGKLNLIVDECVASTIKMNFPPHSLPSKNTQSNLNLAYMHLRLKELGVEIWCLLAIYYNYNL